MFREFKKKLGEINFETHYIEKSSIGFVVETMHGYLNRDKMHNMKLGKKILVRIEQLRNIFHHFF